MNHFHLHKKGDLNNPKVILIHGLLGASRNLWRLQDILVENGFYTLSYDQRGHGHSPHSEGKPLTLERLSEDLINILNSENLKKVHLLGHSMGGRVAMMTSYLHPERVESLTMMDVSPKVSTLAITTLHKIIDPLPDTFANKTIALDFFRAHLPFTGKELTMFEQFLMANLKNDNGVYKWVFDLSAIRKDLLPSLSIDQFEKWKQLKIPTFVMRGERSAHFTQQELDTMTEMLPEIQTYSVSNAGHWIHADNLEDTATGTLTFLKQFNHLEKK